MKLYFPRGVDNNFNYFEQQRQYAILHLDYSINPSKELEEKLKQLEDFFIEQMKPVRFRIVNGSNEIIDRSKDFDKGCASFREIGIHDARDLTMYDFRILMESQKDKSEKLKKHGAAELQ